MTEVNGQQLPDGWVTCELSEISTIVMGQSPPSSTYNSTGDGLPFFQGKADFGNLYPDARIWCSRPGKIAEKNDILLCVRAPVGPTNLAPAKSCIGRGLSAVHPEHGVNLKYLLYALRRFAAELDNRGTGTTFKAISGKVVRTFPIPIAPSSEQTRIADTLDELLSDLDAGVVALERARAKLKHYRAAVLKAAVEGALTADWRDEHPDIEPATAPLTRILAERRRRWEESQLEKFKAAGKEPPKNWKAKYQEPIDPDTTNLPTLPDGWCWASLDQLAWASGYGTSQKCSEINKGLPVLRIPNIIGGKLNLEKIKYASPKYRESDRELVDTGDLLVVRTNGSRTLIGRGAVVREKPNGRFSFASYLIRLRLIPLSPLLKWISFLWDSSLVRQWIETRAATSAGQHNISLGVLEPLVLPLPPEAEQEQLAESLEDQFSVIEHLEADLEAKLESSQALRQSILRHAFTGKLVPQDPNDEPASELLKRIAAEREERARKAAAIKQTVKRTRTPRRRVTVKT